MLQNELFIANELRRQAEKAGKKQHQHSAPKKDQTVLKSVREKVGKSLISVGQSMVSDNTVTTAKHAEAST